MRGASKLALTTNDALSLYLRASGGSKIPPKLTMLLPPNRPSHIDFATLLSTHTSVHAVSSDAHTHSLATSRGLHSILAPAHITQSPRLLTRFAAWAAIQSSHTTVLLPETAHDDALHSLTAQCGSLAPVSSTAPGVEMLPPGALTFVRPLLALSPSDLRERAQSLGAPLSAARAHGARRRDAVRSLAADSDAVLRDCVLEVSHWGFLVLQRSVLAGLYRSDDGSRVLAMEALARAMTHVSGSAERLLATSRHVRHIADAALAPDCRGELPPLPKGRTASGMVLRRATGRFARRIAEREARRKGVPRGEVRFRAPDDLIILTREPDREKFGLFERRQGGNFACASLSRPAYWDNRYVMMAKPLCELREGVQPMSDADVLEAVLRPGKGDVEEDLRECELYARQFRRADWEYIASLSTRLRTIIVPYECLRALPAVFEKKRGGRDLGMLAASPHLGLTARADMLFSAIRVPRHRTLPDDMCPGFVLEKERNERAEQSRRTANRLNVQLGLHRRPLGRADTILERTERQEAPYERNF